MSGGKTLVARAIKEREVVRVTANTFMLVFDMIMLGYGPYLAYQAYQMKQTGKPPSSLITKQELVGAKDIPGFCVVMFKPMAIFGVALAIYGAVGLANDLIFNLPGVNIIALVLLILLCAWFMKHFKKAKAEYLG